MRLVVAVVLATCAAFVAQVLTVVHLQIVLTWCCTHASAVSEILAGLSDLANDSD